MKRIATYYYFLEEPKTCFIELNVLLTSKYIIMCFILLKREKKDTIIFEKAARKNKYLKEFLPLVDETRFFCSKRLIVVKGFVGRKRKRTGRSRERLGQCVP